MVRNKSALLASKQAKDARDRDQYGEGSIDIKPQEFSPGQMVKIMNGQKKKVVGKCELGYILEGMPEGSFFPTSSLKPVN